MFGPMYIFFFIWVGMVGIATSHGAEIVDRIVAVVNDDIITLNDLNHALKPYSDRIKSMGHDAGKEDDVLTKLRKDILDRLIDHKLTDQEIKKAKLGVSDEEVDGAIEKIKEKNFLSDADFRKVLADEGLSFEEYRKNMKDQMLRSRLVNREVKSKIVNHCTHRIREFTETFHHIVRRFIVGDKCTAVLRAIKAAYQTLDCAKLGCRPVFLVCFCPEVLSSYTGITPHERFCVPFFIVHCHLLFGALHDAADEQAHAILLALAQVRVRARIRARVRREPARPRALWPQSARALAGRGGSAREDRRGSLHDIRIRIGWPGIILRRNGDTRRRYKNTGKRTGCQFDLGRIGEFPLPSRARIL